MRTQFSVLSLMLFVLVGCQNASEQPESAAAEAQAPVQKATEWSYAAASGPDNWGSLDAAFAECQVGEAQSPIALTSAQFESADLPPLTFSYASSTLKVEDTGHGFKATPDGEHTLAIGDDMYKLLQFHAHTPSEHTLDGKSFPMEIHFVHMNDAGELAVVGVMVETGAPNEAFASFLAQVEEEQEEGADMVAELEAKLPESKAYVTYPGSLTTPPCSEGVRWNVLTNSITFSEEQMALLASAHGVTNRPVQPLNDRVVRTSN